MMTIIKNLDLEEGNFLFFSSMQKHLMEQHGFIIRGVFLAIVPRYPDAGVYFYYV